jgi:hypothetical protein
MTTVLLCGAGPFAAAQPANASIRASRADRNAVGIVSVSAAAAAASATTHRVYEDRSGLRLLRSGIG